MKIQKALKYKKRLGADIARLQSLIQRKNSTPETSTIKYDILGLMEELNQSTFRLIRLKVAINIANLPIQKSLYKIGELKSNMAFYKNINTREGTTSSYGDKEVTYIAQFDEKETAAMLISTQDAIDDLQEKIDTFNYTTEVDFKE